MYWDTTGLGRWVYRHYDPATQRLTGHRLGGPGVLRVYDVLPSKAAATR